MRKLVTIIDDVLPPSLFAELRRRVRRVGNERLAKTYQTTFWFPFGDPSNVVEEVISSVSPRVLRPGIEVQGAEWWLSRMRTTDVRIDFHVDHDIARRARGGRRIHPEVSSVLFLNRCRGGLLAVTKAAPNPRNPACAPDRLDFSLVAPKPNRFIYFAGHLTHGVLDAHNAIPAAPLGGEGPLRLAVIINWWRGRPEGVPRFDETKIYRRLKRSKAASRRARPNPA